MGLVLGGDCPLPPDRSASGALGSSGPRRYSLVVFEGFTDQARRVLVLAQEEAHLFNHSFIATEHILLGLIREGDGIGAQALGALGLSVEGVRAKVEATIGSGQTSASGFLPFTPRATMVLESSRREALQLGHSYIGTEHMLLGLTTEGEGLGATALISLGADLGRVRQEVIERMSDRQSPPGGGPVDFSTHRRGGRRAWNHAQAAEGVFKKWLELGRLASWTTGIRYRSISCTARNAG